MFFVSARRLWRKGTVTSLLHYSRQFWCSHCSEDCAERVLTRLRRGCVKKRKLLDELWVNWRFFLCTQWWRESAWRYLTVCLGLWYFKFSSWETNSENTEKGESIISNFRDELHIWMLVSLKPYSELVPRGFWSNYIKRLFKRDLLANFTKKQKERE